MKLILRFTGLAFFAALVSIAPALAQNYPTSPIRFIVPFPASARINLAMQAGTKYFRGYFLETQ